MKMMKMTPRQRLMHGFMEYIHDYAMREIQYEVTEKWWAKREKKLAKEKEKLANKSKGKKLARKKI